MFKPGDIVEPKDDHKSYLGTSPVTIAAIAGKAFEDTEGVTHAVSYWQLVQPADPAPFKVGDRVRRINHGYGASAVGVTGTITYVDKWDVRDTGDDVEVAVDVTGELCYWSPRNIELIAPFEPTAPVATNSRKVGDVLFNSQETIVTGESGGSKGSKPVRYDLIPVEALAEVAYIFGVGAIKYGERNAEKGYAYSLSIAALQRHLEKFKSGVDFDDDAPADMPQPHHLAAVIFHALALMNFQAKGVGVDDRA